MKIESSGPAGIQQAELMGSYVYQSTEIDGTNSAYQIFRGPNNEEVYYGKGVWMVSSFNG